VLTKEDAAARTFDRVIDANGRAAHLRVNASTVVDISAL